MRSHKACTRFALRQEADYREKYFRDYAPFATTCQVTPMRGPVLPRENVTMANGEQDIMEDLAYAEVEGQSETMEDEGDLFDSLESDGLEDYADLSGEDGFDSLEDEFEAEESVGAILGQALGAEDEDEFFGKLFAGAKKLAQKAAPWVGKIARGAAPILSMIPHPAAQAAGKVAGVLGKLRAEGATVEDALEAVAEIAARDRRALPVVAGLAARSVVQNRGAAMGPAQRRQVANTMTRAAKTLVASGGPKAIRALPRITRSVKRTAGARGTPPSVQPKVVARTAAKVAQNPPLLRRLSSPSPQGQATVQRTVGNGGLGGSRTFTVPGPATITINVG
jgi:hypothetical protein